MVGARADPTSSARFTRRWLAVTDLADDGDVRRHAQEAGNEAPQIDLSAVGTSGARLHVRDVRQAQRRH
jgi:hypothetical protein